ncbi:unnamed protein product [Closterium sp. Naga37s-1]|nr:unnamed protein product [Closterium sp. Naga37s-1]
MLSLLRTGAASAQQAETAGAPLLIPAYTPSSVAEHRAYQSAPLLRPPRGIMQPSEVVPLNPPPPPAQSPAENPTARAPAAEPSCSRSPASRDNAPPAAAGATACAARDSAAPSRTPAAPSRAPGDASPTFREFSYAELHAATGGFAPARVIGEGGFGTVYRGRMVLPADDGAMRECDVAVKMMKDEQFIDQELKSFKAEVAAMSALKHSNIVKLQGVAFDTEQSPLLVYEYIPGGDVTNLLKRVRRNEDQFPWKERVMVALGCAEALAYSHKKGIIHRDFKSSNVLLREDRSPVVADFDLARSMEDSKTHVWTGVAGTWVYIDPAYFQTGKLYPKSDTYSFGVFLLELVFGYPPHEEEYKATFPMLDARPEMREVVGELRRIWSEIER